MTAMGHSFTVVRGNALSGAANDTNTSTADLTLWNWHIADEAYWKIQANANNTWTAWSPDGTRYEFVTPLRWGWKGDPGESDQYETYKWLLTSVVDPSGSKITFNYAVDTLNPYGSPIDPTYRLSSILWGYDGVNGTGSARYQLTFDASDRQAAGVDVDWDFSANQVYTNTDPKARNGSGAPHEKYKLDTITFAARRTDTNAFQNVTKWTLGYAASANSVRTDGENGQRMLTLLSVTRSGWNTATGAWNALPATAFTYGMSRGTTSPTPPTPGWNRLLTATNGYGGKVTYTYEHVWSPAGYGGAAIPSGEGYYEGSPYAYRFRVASMLAQDIAGESYSKSVLTTYVYTNPALNTRDYSAVVWYAMRTPPGTSGDSAIYLASSEKSEFRGHDNVITRVYDGATTSATLLRRTQTWFYQGRQLPGGCIPSLIDGTNGAIDYLDTSTTATCYQDMVRNEAWRGRAYKEEVHNASGAAMQRTETAYAYAELPFYNSTASNGYRRAGIWRVFTGKSQVTESVITTDGTSSKRTEYYYVGGCGTGAPTAYGQVVCQKEFDQQGALVRKIEHAYASSGSTYIVSRNIATTISDSANVYQAHSQRFYDGNNTTLGSIGNKGQLTREIQVSNIGGLTSVTNQTLYGTDTTSTYTAFGELETRTTYSAPGWVRYTGSSWTASAPGNGSTAHDTRTSYDTLFRHMPISVQYPLSAGGAPLTESASYDYLLGVLTSVTDFNGNATTATYDPFGRLLTIRRPGDSAGIPTVKAIYYDTEQPFRYRVEQREAGSDNRVTQLFYDGLGRQIQTKLEDTVGSTLRNIVTDSVYDGLDRAIQQSQARDVTETSTTFTQYTDIPAAPNDAVMRWTKTSYDLLGRISTAAIYDGASGYRTTSHMYGVLSGANPLRWHDTVDANRHRVQERFDSLGRRVEVDEISGNCGDYWPGYTCTESLHHWLGGGDGDDLRLHAARSARYGDEYKWH